MKKTILLLAALITTAIGAMAQTDPLAGKRIGVIGDSYVKNHQNPVEYAWHSKLAKKHGMKYYNYGRNGSCVSIDMKTWGPAVVNRYQQMNDSLDVVVVIAGHNDAARLANAVTDSTTTLNNYREQCTKLCKGLIEKYPRAYIYWFTPWANDNPNFKVIVDATKDICGSMGIPVFDAYQNSNIFARSDQFRQIYFQGGKARPCTPKQQGTRPFPSHRRAFHPSVSAIKRNIRQTKTSQRNNVISHETVTTK